jgi:hypothetical protein
VRLGSGELYKQETEGVYSRKVRNGEKIVREAEEPTERAKNIERRGRGGSGGGAVLRVDLTSTRAISAYSIFGASKCGPNISLLNRGFLGNCLSIRLYARGAVRFGSSISLLDCLELGSTMSVRSAGRLGSAFRRSRFATRSIVRTIPLSWICPGSAVVYRYENAGGSNPA